jgi:hypothetical protein
MAQARPVAQGIPQAAIYFAAALIASVVISAMLLIGNVRLFGPSTDGGGAASPHVLRSEAMWMTERLAQSGYIDPATRSAREWERQRRQQSSGF